jgi:hypothetical protein
MPCLARYRAYARAVIPLIFVALSAAVNASAAQSADEQAAYAAFIYTPVAGLPPLPPIADSVSRNNGSGVSLLGRLGHMSRDGGALAAAMAIAVSPWRGE